MRRRIPQLDEGGNDVTKVVLDEVDCDEDDNEIGVLDNDANPKKPFTEKLDDIWKKVSGKDPKLRFKEDIYNEIKEMANDVDRLRNAFLPNCFKTLVGQQAGWMGTL